MGTMTNMLRNRNYAVPDQLEPIENFRVRNKDTNALCLVFFWVDGKAGVSVTGDIIKQMDSENAYEAILVTDGLTPQASIKLNSTPNVCVMTPQSLKFDVSKHKHVPPHRIMTRHEKEALRKKYGDLSNLPMIHLDDPVSKYMGARTGDVFEITRNRPNVGKDLYYRQVVKTNK